MTIYVDELPKSCERCPFHDTKYGICDISGLRVEYFGCHSLTPLSDYTKQVRKEVFETIQSDLLDFSHSYWRVFKQNGKQYMTDDDIIECLDEILKKIQGE